MERLLACLLVLSLTTSGCVSRSTAKAQAQAAFAAGQQQQSLRQQQAPSVFVRGEVKNGVITWTEGLTLAQAIVAAEYTGLLNPRAIILTRQGQSYFIAPNHLVRGQEDRLLEPGDVVELRR